MDNKNLLFMQPLFPKSFNYDNQPIPTTNGLRYNIALISYDRVEGCGRKVVREWSDLPFELLMKYQWHFRRVAAIHQLQEPRRVFGFEISRHRSEQEAIVSERKHLRDKITSAKAKITQAQNELARLRAGWKELFPIEQHPKWQATEKKLREKQAQLAMMEEQYCSFAQSII